MKKFKLLIYLILAWIFAMIYEEVPRFILPNSQHLWQMGDGWFLFFLLWYGTLFIIAYFLLINRPIKYAVIFGILYGLIFETFYFKMMHNIFSFIIFVLIYFGLFYFPFKIIKIIYDKEKTTRKEKFIVISTQLFALFLLLFFAMVG